MSWRSNRFSNGLHSLDWMVEECGTSKMLNLSDRGAGAARVVREADTTPGSIAREEAAFDSAYDRRLNVARMRLVRANLAYLLPVLRLIVENGSRRRRSIREIAARNGSTYEAAEKLYFAQRKKLENFFCAQ